MDQKNATLGKMKGRREHDETPWEKPSAPRQHARTWWGFPGGALSGDGAGQGWIHSPLWGGKCPMFLFVTWRAAQPGQETLLPQQGPTALSLNGNPGFPTSFGRIFWSQDILW